jgi:nucleoside-diphosphate-sugar epimerase
MFISIRALRLSFNNFRDQSIAALRKTDLEWTRIHTGFFLDYYGMPHIASYLTPLVWAIDIGNKKAAIPGTAGNETVTFTYTKDLAKFVVAALSLSKWDETLHCYSENITLNQMLKIAEDVTGE